MNLAIVRDVVEHWANIAPLFNVPHDETSYQELVNVLDTVLDQGGADEHHPLASLANILGDLLAEYEEQAFTLPQPTGLDALKYLIESQGIKQSELPEIGSQGVVSEILNGKRELNIRQIRALAQRFSVSEQTFI